MADSDSYFYCYSLPLEVGSVILPGNWGRILSTYTPETSPNSWLLVRELVFEKVRIADFPKMPSRLESIFLCQSKKDIEEFKNTNNRKLDLIYEVELLDSDSSIHVGELTLTNMQNVDNTSIFSERAKKYWEGKEITKSEVVTTSRIRIIKTFENAT